MSKLIKTTISIVVFALACMAVLGCGETNATGANNNSDPQTPAWFANQVTAAKEAVTALTVAKGAEERGYKAFFNNNCYGIENPTGGVPCKERWVNSRYYEVMHGDVTRAEAHLQILLGEYEAEAKKADFSVHPAKLAVLNGQLVNENGQPLP